MGYYAQKICRLKNQTKICVGVHFNKGWDMLQMVARYATIGGWILYKWWQGTQAKVSLVNLSYFQVTLSYPQVTLSYSKVTVSCSQVTLNYPQITPKLPQITPKLPSLSYPQLS